MSRRHSCALVPRRTPAQNQASAAIRSEPGPGKRARRQLASRGMRLSARRARRPRHPASNQAPICISLTSEGSARTIAADDRPRE